MGGFTGYGGGSAGAGGLTATERATLAQLLASGGFPAPQSWAAADVATALPVGWQATERPSDSVLAAAEWRTHGAGGITLGIDRASSYWNPSSAAYGRAANALQIPWFGRELDCMVKLTTPVVAGVSAVSYNHFSLALRGGGKLQSQGAFVSAAAWYYAAADTNAGSPAWFANAKWKVPYGQVLATGSADQTLQVAKAPALATIFLRLVVTPAGAKAYVATALTDETDPDDAGWTQLVGTGGSLTPIEWLRPTTTAADHDPATHVRQLVVTAATDQNIGTAANRLAVTVNRFHVYDWS